MMRRSISLFPLLALAGLLLGGCVSRAERDAALNAYIGIAETDLVRQLGVPDRSIETDGRRFLAYEVKRTQILPGSPFYTGFDGPRLWGMGGSPPQLLELACQTSFEIANGHVASWTQRGNAC